MEEIIQTTISTTMNEVIKNSNLLCFDWATLAISIIAIIISVWSVKNTFKASALADDQLSCGTISKK